MEKSSMRTARAKIYAWIQQRIRWLTRPLILAIFGLVLLNASRPDILNKLGQWFGFASPSLATMLAVMILIFLVERVLLLEEIFRPPVKIYNTRMDAYDDFESIFAKRHIDRIDLVQFTGITAMNFLHHVIRNCPAVRVRMLVASDQLAMQYNRPRRDHNAHITTTFQNLDGLRSESALLAVKRYSSNASLSCLIIDDQIVLRGWYRTYCDDHGIVHLRGHDSPGVMAMGIEAAHLLTFARKQFDILWNGATPYSLVELTEARDPDAGPLGQSQPIAG